MLVGKVMPRLLSTAGPVLVFWIVISSRLPLMLTSSTLRLQAPPPPPWPGKTGKAGHGGGGHCGQIDVCTVSGSQAPECAG